ncbi:FAD-dependent monooxygenase [Streptomyces daliensis]
MEQDVVIAGAGPVGLWLAAELRLGGAEVTVLESRERRSPHSKALTLHPRTLELLAQRGLADAFLSRGRRIPNGHFGGLDDRMDFRPLDTPYPFTLALPQAVTEELLEEHALAKGVRVLRGHRVTGLTRHADSVTVTAEGPQGARTWAAGWLVGCDGAGSTVRGEAGIGFPGTDTTTWGWLGDVVLDEPPRAGAMSLATPEGGMMAVPLPGGVHRLVGGGPDDMRPDWPGELTLGELRDKVRRIAGTDFGMRDPLWLSRFGNATRQAERYRDGRVLLAGDAAHMHFPTGGVGLNVGVQDAANLGWKLAAVVRGGAPEALLDTYHGERHPVGAELLEHTRAQTALMTAFSPEGQALRAVLSRLIATVPGFSRELAERLAGLSVRYPAPDGAHPLTGSRAPDLRLAEPPHHDGLFGLLTEAAGRPVLLLLTEREDDGSGLAPRHRHQEAAEKAAAHLGLSGPLTTCRAVPADQRPEWRGVGAALVRPDGHVAWAADAGSGTGAGAGSGTGEG